MRYLNNIYSLLTAVGCIVFILLYAFLGERGLMNVLSLKKGLREMENYNQSLKAENDKLKDYIYLLRNDKKYIEIIAREELGLVRNEELIYLFETD